MKADQFVLGEDGRLKLNDFNKGHLMYWNTTSNASTCSYSYVRRNPNSFASPEEYFNGERNEMTDVYSMGNVLYLLLTGKDPYNDFDGGREDIIGLVKKGKKPKLGRDILESDDYVDKVLVKAVAMCFVHDWHERYSSTEIRDFLVESLKEIN
jgi:serine/threonine protein kinase